jgi:hypothetical protein
VDPVPEPLLLRELGTAGNRTPTCLSVARTTEKGCMKFHYEIKVNAKCQMIKKHHCKSLCHNNKNESSNCELYSEACRFEPKL